jgi:type IV secretory pathway VirB2 component (pilin)
MMINISITKKRLSSITRTLVKLSIILIILFIPSSDAFAGCGDQANPALKTICDVMRLLQGRLGRAFSMIIVIMKAWELAQGGVEWKNLVIFFTGISIFWAPKTIALFILPNYITGVYGEGYTPDQKLTPDEIIACACPDLR